MKKYALTAFLSADVTVEVIAESIEQAVCLASETYPASRYSVRGPGKLKDKELRWSNANVSTVFDEESVHVALTGAVFMITHWGQTMPLRVPNLVCTRAIAKAIRANSENEVSVEEALTELKRLQLGEGSAFWSWGHVIRVSPAILQQDVVESPQPLSECALY